MKKCILIIGVRRQCYEAAIRLGYDVVLWSDEKLKPKRKKDLLGWIELPYVENYPALSPQLIAELKKYKIERVISNTEETVVIGALVRQHLGIKRISVDVTDRFHDKLKMKNFATSQNIKITKYKIIESATTAQELIDYLGLPLVIKPTNESGAQAITVSHNLEEVRENFRPGFLAEAFVKGSEVSVETFIQQGKPLFHNITEYLHQWRKSVVPASLDPKMEQAILKMNDEIIAKFGVDRGMTHAEYYLTDDGPVFGEIAIRPPGGYYMDLIKSAYNIDAWEFYIKLCCEEEVASITPELKGCAAVYMIHPGAGLIKSISGVEAIKNEVDGIIDFSIRKKIGDTILAHENTSNEIGHILFWAQNREKLNQELEYIDSNLVFELEQ